MILPTALTYAKEVTLGKSKHGTDARPGWKVWAIWHTTTSQRAGSIEVEVA